ncbi:MAG: NAD(P)/FAD-dependent oxidoreductase, partial [Chthoniobacterales bacterium]
MALELHDVAIIGGGPAGSTAAALLARAGRRVVILERDKFPRFHIGESLLPFSMKAFARLGLHEKFKRAGFMEKFGGEMCGACSSEGVKFYFEDGFGSQTDRSYQVPRAEFDKLLLDHARESGAEVREETAVEKLDFSADEVTLTIAGGAKVHAKYVIDASGRNSLIGMHFKLKKNYSHLQKISIFAHFDGVERASGRDGTLTKMVRAIDRWFWHIPLTANRTSIGVVLDSAVFKASKLSPEEFLQRALDEQPILADRMQAAERVTPVHVAADFSYRNTRFTGDRWMLAGDAAGFIDPVFSSGV